MLEQWDSKPQLVCLEDLYLSGPETMLEAIGNANRGLNRVMVLAHNPGTSLLASMLANESMEMVTAAVAVFDVNDIDSLGNSNVSPHAPLSHLSKHLSTQGGCTLTHFASPKTI